MKSGYEILWTDHALKELAEVFNYLNENWSEKELRILANKIEETLCFIAENPYLY